MSASRNGTAWDSGSEDAARRSPRVRHRARAHLTSWSARSTQSAARALQAARRRARSASSRNRTRPFFSCSRSRRRQGSPNLSARAGSVARAVDELGARRRLSSRCSRTCTSPWMRCSRTSSACVSRSRGPRDPDRPRAARSRPEARRGARKKLTLEGAIAARIFAPWSNKQRDRAHDSQSMRGLVLLHGTVRNHRGSHGSGSINPASSLLGLFTRGLTG